MPCKGLGDCDYVSGAAHKFGGPRGVGFLKIPHRKAITPLLHGGKQEGGRRAGTEHVAIIAAMLAALDVRDGQLAVRGWLSGTGLDVDQALARCRAAGVTRLHVTAIARDGTMNGPDLDLYEKVCASGLKVVAAGGVRGDADLAVLEALGCEAAVMGVGFLARLGISF